MELFIVRHGDSPFISDVDHTRPLSDRGCAQAQLSGQFIAKNCHGADIQIICSDAKRTLRTAQIIQQQLNSPQPQSAAIFYHAMTGHWCDAIMQHKQVEHLVLVGHNPTMSMLSQHLNPIHSFHYKPACVGHFSLEIETNGLKLPAQLNEFFSPDAIQ